MFALIRYGSVDDRWFYTFSQKVASHCASSDHDMHIDGRYLQRYGVVGMTAKRWNPRAFFALMFLKLSGVEDDP